MIFEHEKRMYRIKFTDAYVDHLGAMRWIASCNAVPADIMAFWYSEKMVDASTLAITKVVREEEAAKVVEAYIIAQNDLSDDDKAERAFERRAAFGKGANVVDIFTGKAYRT